MFTPTHALRLVPFWIALATLLLACGPGPKPGNLLALEKKRNSVDFAKIRTISAEDAKQHDVAYKRAINAWQEGEDEDILEFTHLAEIYYEAAELRYRTKEEIQRANNAASLVKDLDMKVEATKKSIQVEEEALLILKKKYDAASYATSAAGLADAAKFEAEGEKAKADGMKANEYAKAEHEKAEAAFNLATAHMQAKRYDEAKTKYDEAKLLYIEANKVAKPKFDAKESIKKLLAEANRDFARDASEMPNGQGVRIVVPRLFNGNKTRINDNKEFLLDFLVNLASKYPQTTILIEGHTLKDNRKSSSIAEDRAEAVKAYLIRNGGIDSGRITTSGIGGSSPRFDIKDRDEKGKNDRVEVLFIPAR